LSIELPEAYILASQMNESLVGKKVKTWNLQEMEKLQKQKMVTADKKQFDRLVGRTIKQVISRGNGIRMQLDQKMNLFLAPEYGGDILYHEPGSEIPKKTHLTVTFTDDSVITVRLKGWGHISPSADDELSKVYVYARDFSDTLDPGSPEFTLQSFKGGMSGLITNIKTALVGKDAVIVGVQNSAFQDIIYRAGIHPKRKVSDLTQGQLETLFRSIQDLIKERIEGGGKDEFTDLHGRQGTYVPRMGPNMKDQKCPKCHASIEKIAHGGGHVYVCPTCQK
jgi:formamidopyrimidine-DNA glycosylase